MGFFNELLFGENGGVSKSDVEKLAIREKLSDFMPYLFYDEDPERGGRFLNTDNTFGHIYELYPMTFAPDSTVKELISILSQKWPVDVVMQFIFVADDHIIPILDAYKANKVRKNALIDKTIDEYSNFLLRGTKGVDKLKGTPVRNFRMFITFKSAEELDYDIISTVEETLNGAGFAPTALKDIDLLEFLRRFINNKANREITNSIDKNIPLRKQIINSENTIEFNEKQRYVKIGDRFARCITPKGMRHNIDTLDTNELVGGFRGRQDDSKQYITPFIWTVNITFKNAKAELNLKTSVTLSQRASGSFARTIARRSEECIWAGDKMDKDNEVFVQFMPIIWIFADTEKELRDATSRAKRIWEKKDFIMQEESILQKALLLAALPFGLYNVGKNIDILDRHFLFPVSTAAIFLPVQADFAGGSKPVLLFLGRKGQLVTIDVFDKRLDNHNFVVMAASGAGKSFKLNNLLQMYSASGSLIRLADLGGSYKKLCRINNGRYLDVAEEKLVINPFITNAKDEEDRSKDIIVASNILGEMTYSSTGQALSETEATLLKLACRWVDKTGDIEKGVDRVQEFLKTYPKHDEGWCSEQNVDVDFAKELAIKMAFNLRDFTSTGVYGRFFNGQSTFDISNDHFVVMELEALKPQKELFAVMFMQVINSITNDLYLSSRDTQRFILIEEAARFLKTSGLNDLSRVGAIIEDGYRRARKYEGSFGVVLQSALDTLSFGSIGEVIMNNADIKFYLAAKDYSKASDQKVIPHQGLALELLEGVRNNRPHYSEMFIDSELYRGVARLCVDPWFYQLATSDGKEVAAFEKLIAKGLRPEEAISILSGIPL